MGRNHKQKWLSLTQHMIQFAWLSQCLYIMILLQLRVRLLTRPMHFSEINFANAVLHLHVLHLCWLICFGNVSGEGAGGEKRGS